MLCALESKHDQLLWDVVGLLLNNRNNYFHHSRLCFENPAGSRVSMVVNDLQCADR